MFKRLLVSFFATVAMASGSQAPKIPAKRVVLVHGLFQNKWRCFGFLNKDLEKRGVECLIPSLKPADGRDGLPGMAQQLKKAIDDRFGPDEHVVLISFSMGGLISRHYLQELGGAQRCDGFFTISTPHHGTRAAHLLYGKGGRQMEPESPWLGKLAASEDKLGDMPIVSYRTPADLIILPSESSIWDRAENISVPSPLHPLMTFSPTVRRDILRRLETPVAMAQGAL
ncbi:esterase/lipase family protein [Luteolibacter marinus]|uniref:esterase/lipase family protein n=1 Tax=Luteolibacter marinus TaxID=2776705 RepID=UPI00186886B8|nr:alpha/beta fold hydrolase [Luteolibacter marinus]